MCRRSLVVVLWVSWHVAWVAAQTSTQWPVKAPRSPQEELESEGVEGERKSEVEGEEGDLEDGFTGQPLNRTAQRLVEQRIAATFDKDLDGAPRSFLCVPLVRVFAVELDGPLQPGERLGLTGDHAKLGAWRLNASLAMPPTDEDGLSWLLKVPLCASGRILYRYFVFHEDGRGGRQVRRWEGHPHARVMQAYEPFRHQGVERFGEVYGALNGVETERGWLVGQRVVQLQFVWARHFRFRSRWSDRPALRIRIRLQAFEPGCDRPVAGSGETLIEVARLARNRSLLRQQPARGVTYAPGDVVLFQVTTTPAKQFSFLLQLSGRGGAVLGSAVILPWQLRASAGVLQLPVQAPVPAGGDVVGLLTLPFLVVQPLPYAPQLGLRASFHRYWPENWPAMDVGRRGAGRGFGGVEAAQVENTIASFLFALAHRADMVSLELQVTRDYVPVVWRDTGFLTAEPGLAVRSERQLEFVRVQDLTYRQLRRSRVFVRAPGGLAEISDLNDRNASRLDRIFPPLDEVLLTLPRALGLEVVLRWPQRLLGGGWDAPSPRLDKNRFVDAVLNGTLAHGCGRPLVFSSPDPDLCAMLRLKQNVFPVTFRTEDRHAPWGPLKDLRTRALLDAVGFAQAQDLLGTASHADDFLAEPALVQRALELRQAVFVWGDGIGDRVAVQRLKDLGATGVVYDRLERRRPPAKRAGFFDEELLLETFGRQCGALEDVAPLLGSGWGA